MKKVVRLAEKFLSDIPALEPATAREPFGNYVPTTKVIKKPIVQGHAAFGLPAYALTDPRRIPFFLLSNILGGPSMNSRLNLGLREKFGLVYSIDATYSVFSDTGMFTISFASEKNQLHRCVDLVIRELKRFRQQPMSELQLHKAKEQLIGQMAMGEENNISLMLILGKSTLDLNRVDSFEAVSEKIRQITAMQLQDVANEMFDESQYSYLYYKPTA
jgi:predicted Zn-dependent peptidase